MLILEPNTVYTPKDIRNISDFGITTIYEWFKDERLRSFSGHGGKMVTGRALLEYFETKRNNESEQFNNKTELMDISSRLKERLEKDGIRHNQL